MVNRPLTVCALLTMLFSVTAMAVDHGTDDRLVMAQIHRLPGTTDAEIDAYLARLQSAGFNTVILRVFHNRGDRYHALAEHLNGTRDGGVYFPTSIAPVLEDVLTPVARLCRARGMKIFAWITTRTMDWLEEPAWRDFHLDETLGGIVLSRRRYDLFNPGFQGYLQNLLQDLSGADIDGIVLQDDFAILTREGFSSHGLAAWQEAMDTRLNPREFLVETASGKKRIATDSTLFGQWAVFKSRYLLGLLSRLVDTIHETSEDILIAWNLYHDTALTPEHGLFWIGQDIDLVENMPADLVLLMAYHRQAAQERQRGVTETIEDLSAEARHLWQRLGNRLVIKLQARDWSDSSIIPATELRDFSRQLPPGVCHIALAPVEDGQEEMIRLQTVLRNVADRQ